MRELFVTEVPDEPFNMLWAKDADDARRLIRGRMRGEKLLGSAREALGNADEAITRTKLASEWLDERNYPEAIHAAAWTLSFATRLNLVSCYSLFREKGLMHDLAHTRLGQEVQDQQSSGVRFEALVRSRKMLLAIESMTPGFEKYEPGEQTFRPFEQKEFIGKQPFDRLLKRLAEIDPAVEERFKVERIPSLATIASAAVTLREEVREYGA